MHTGLNRGPHKHCRHHPASVPTLFLPQQLQEISNCVWQLDRSEFDSKILAELSRHLPIGTVFYLPFFHNQSASFSDKERRGWRGRSDNNKLL